MRKRTPEALVAHLRRRKLRITFYVIFAIVFAVFAVVWGYLAVQFTTRLIINPETENIETEKIMLTVIGPFMALGAASCFALCLTLCILLGSAVAALIIELTSYTKDDLLVEMWDRIKEIQSKINKQPG
jgi:MFS family permease